MQGIPRSTDPGSIHFPLRTDTMELSSTSDPVYSDQAKETLKGDLDDLLGRYLDLVHRYAIYHQSMTTEFASVS